MAHIHADKGDMTSTTVLSYRLERQVLRTRLVLLGTHDNALS
jgi:hypothetical protein